MYWLSSLGNSFTTSGSSDTKGTVGSCYNYTVGIIFFSCPPYFFFIFTLLTLPTSSVTLPHFILAEFHISYSHTECTFFSLCESNEKLEMERY